MRTALEAEGWRVHEADTAKRTWTRARTGQPDLLVRDLDHLRQKLHADATQPRHLLTEMA